MTCTIRKIETERAVGCPLQQSLREHVTSKRLSITVSILDTLATSCWAKKIITKELNHHHHHHRHYNPLMGQGLLNYRWAFSAGRFYGVLLPITRPTPNLEDNFRHKVPLAPETTRANPVAEGGTMGEKWPDKFCRKATTSTSAFWVILHAVKLRHGTDGFTSSPKEGVLRIFFRPKNPLARYP